MPAPKLPNGTPDLSGTWRADPGGYLDNIASDLKPGETLPWTEALFKRRSEEFATGHPTYKCMPDIGPLYTFGIFKVLQTPATMAMLSEWGPFRQIVTDGRDLPKDPSPTWMGYSIGRWDGDTFVVSSAGFNDQTWLDYNGHPHTEALRVTGALDARHPWWAARSWRRTKARTRCRRPVAAPRTRTRWTGWLNWWATS